MAEINLLDSEEVEKVLNDEERIMTGNLKLQLAAYLKEEDMMWRQK